ncbi:MAG: tRNA (guanosine(37)-N1)-methyltransferase TrmD [Actinomycetota bacterium]
MSLRIDVATIFPGYFEGPLREALLGKALKDGALRVQIHDLREHTSDKHRTVDDTPFGGGPGMVMKPEPWFDTVEAISGWQQARRILFTPAGRRLDQRLVEELATEPHLILMCGRYEGIDERVSQGLSTDEVSVGDLVLSGGEAAAVVLIEAISRLVEGVIGDPDSVAQDSFTSGLLDHPHYTRPAEFRGMKVPEVLLSGDHARIEAWRRRQAEERTRQRRPDLM